MMSRPYGRDLARIHDIGFGFHAESAGPQLLELMRKRGVRSGHVVDLGCGSGIWAAMLCAAGYQVTGYDISADMLRIARRRAPRARFHRASFLDADLPGCDVVTSMGECLGYQFDGRAHRARLRRLFARVFRALRPGGLFVFDLATYGRSGTRGLVERCFSGEDWAVLLRLTGDRGHLVRDITTFTRSGRAYRRDHEVHELALYPSTHVAGWLRAAGFRVRVRRGYGSCRFKPGLVAFVARKPAR
jgi:SAM-dependent methyltransferase